MHASRLHEEATRIWNSSSPQYRYFEHVGKLPHVPETIESIGGSRMAKPLATDQEWKVWGQHDPMYGVAAWVGRDKMGNNPWTESDFFELGRRDWADFYSLWKKFFPVNQDSILEIGCGAGRITKQLAGTFVHVFAIDVSRDMMAFAKNNIKAGNVTFIESSGAHVPLDNASVSSVFSCHVFQHLESITAVKEYLKDVYRVLKPGGHILIHVPIHQFPIYNKTFSKFAELQYSLFLRVSALKDSAKRMRMRHGGAPFMHGISLEQTDAFRFLEMIGYERITFVSFQVTSDKGIHNCILAMKPA